jgi:hypothetical protein
MQDVLLDFLATWKGRGVTQAELEQRGFFIHRAWQERVIDFGGGRDADNVHRYWDEVAREFVARAGNGHPDSRTFVVEARYRSSYLDDLAMRRDYSSPLFRDPPLERGVPEYCSRTSLDRSFLESESAAYEELKHEEAVGHAVTTKGWTGLKRDIVPIMRDFATLKGFVVRRDRFRKKLQQDIVLELKVDQGWIRECGNELPLQLFIYDAGNPDFVFDASLLDMIVPGFSNYQYCLSPGSHVLGILAFVELADILGGTFSPSP